LAVEQIWELQNKQSQIRTYKKDILKIGYTTRTVEERIDELSSTGVQQNFNLNYA
jgi:hypothetical protein